MFMNEGKKPFKELSGDDMKMVVDNFDRAEFYTVHIGGWWVACTDEDVCFDSIYRIPNQLDHFDWSVVDPKWKHLRRDKDGGIYLYGTPTAPGSSQWNPIRKGYDKVINITKLFSESAYKNNGIPWDKMILDRPEGV